MSTTTSDVAPADLRDGEQAYPNYRIDVRWSQFIEPGQEYPLAWTKGLPEGRFWNHTGWDTMEREDRSLMSFRDEVIGEWWPKYVEKKQLQGYANLTVEVKLVRREVWCDGWFSHWTFDTGMSDEQVIASFERYVERILYSGLPENEIGGRLMGAEDYWRWHGCVTGDPQGERTPPPCRCEHCKAQGVVRIGH